MGTVILPLVLLTLCALAIASLCKRKLEDTLAVTALGVMLILYAFYAFNLLRVGRWVVIAACAGLIAVAGVRLVHRRGAAAFAKEILFTPQLALYAGLCVLFYFLSQGKLVGMWDELRLWGSLPKALHFYGTLQFGEEASLYSFSQSYPPVMPLLQYFFASFTAAFSEGSLFFTRAWFGLALLLPLTRSMTWKNWHGIAAITFLLLFVPYWLTTNDPDFAYYYESLYVDAPAGLLCGYLCWQAMKGCYKDKFSTAVFAVTLAALTLMKDFGVLFGGLCLLGSLKWMVAGARQGRRRPAIGKTAIAAAALGVSYLSWQMLMKIYGVVNYNTVTATIPSLSTLFGSLGYFFQTVFTVDLSIASLSVSFGAYLLVLILLYALLVYRRNKDLREDWPFILLRVIGYGGYFFAYVMMFRDDIAASTYPSIARYMVAMLLCESYVFLMTWMRTSKREERFLHRPFSQLKTAGKVTAAVLTAVLLALSAATIHGFWKYDGGVYGDAATAAALVEETVTPADGEIDDIWLVIGGDAWENSLLHHRIYFDLVGSGTRIKNYILPTNITQSGQCYTPDTFLAALAADSYEYVLVIYGDDELAEEFGSLFTELIPYETDFLLYQVESAANGGVSLVLAGEVEP